MTIVTNPARLGDRGRIPRPLRDRIEDKIELAENGCWIWQGALDSLGYGHLWVGSRVTGDRTPIPAHRASYAAFVGQIPDGLVLDHLCRNPSCVNPNHLEPVRQRENVLRGVAPSARNARKTHCPRNHPYDEANTRVYRGKRYCIACARKAATA